MKQSSNPDGRVILPFTVKKVRKAQSPREAAPAIATQAPPSNGSPGAWRAHAWRLAAIWALALAAYSNSFQAGLLFDNEGVILQDPRVHASTLQNIGQILTQGYWHSNPNSGLYRPLTTVSYLFNYAVLEDGAHPADYHRINFALHAANVALVYAAGVLIFGEARLAMALAAIWGLHPLLTESVTNVVGRADLLAAFGVLAGLLCYVKSGSTTGRTQAAWRVALVIAQAVGLFSKENAAVLPGIMLLYDVTWPDRAKWRDRAFAYASLALPFAAFFYLRSGLQTHMVIDPSENPLVNAGFWTARFTAIKILGESLWLFVWPAQLSADYSYNAIPLFGWRFANWEDAKAWIGLAVCISAILVAFQWRRTRKALFFFMLFFFIAAAPTSNLIILIGSIMGEQFLYLPSVGLAGCLVIGVRELGRRLSIQRPMLMQALRIAMVMICLPLAWRSYARNADWHDDLSLWTSTVNVCPEGARPHLNLGIALSRLPGRLPDAIAEYRTALRISPNLAEAHYQLGAALAKTPGDLQAAIDEYRAALRIQPDSADVHNNLGIALSQLPGRLPEAITEWRAALRIEPEHAGAHHNLGIALSETGRLEEAIAEWQAAVRSDVNLPDVHYNLGNYYSKQPGRLADAIKEYEAAVASEPDFAEAQNNLGNALAQVPGRMQDAIVHWQAAVRVRPDLAEAHYNLGTALAQMPGRLPDAIWELETGLRIRPNPQMRQILDGLRARRR